MRTITTDERRRRLGRRHRLAPSAHAADPTDAARSLVGFHATDPASVYLEARARTSGMTVPDLQAALYEARTLVRMIGMRRTLFVVPTEAVAIVNAAATRAIALRERARLLGMLRDAAIAPDPARWLALVEEETLAALHAHGEPVAAVVLSAEVSGLRQQISFGEGRRWAGTMSVATRLLILLAMEGRIVRGRPRGTWISGQYTWTPTDRWLPSGGTTFADIPTEAAQVELVRRWLGAFGPGTARDLTWWTGLTLGAVRRALAGLATAEVQLEGGAIGLVLADDLEPEPPLEPWVALLPPLDATTMGWTARDWYLGPHGAALFDRNGNAGPTIWSDGRIVGGWGQRRSGEVVPQLLEDPGAAARAAIELEAARLGEFIGPARITARFRTPLELELTRALAG